MKEFLKTDTFRRWEAGVQKDPDIWMSRLMFLLGPWACLWMVEMLNMNDILQDLRAMQILLNMVWYYALFAVLRLILGRNRRAAAVGAILCFLVGLLNHYVLRFRMLALFPADIAAWRTAVNVANRFDYSLDQFILQAVILLAAYLFLVWMCAPQKKRENLPLRWSLLLLVAIGIYSYAFFCTGMLPELDICTYQWDTSGNGFLLNFTTAIRYSSLEPPEGYSEDAVLELVEEYPAVEGAGSVTRPTNIVVIMNESFADFTIFDTFEASEDPTPFLHSMKENTIKGWMYSPVTSGGTASVEFEYLTGLSTRLQPPKTIAYMLYMRENMPSLAALARSQGYDAAAFHPYKPSGWNRVKAYEYLDFAHQIYEEDMENGSYIRDFISDSSDYQTIFKYTEAEDATFFFNVTIQNHGGYGLEWDNQGQAIQLADELRQADSTAEQYFALLRESDIALEELITYYGNCEEPTLVVFFGDHQPPLNRDFYEALYGKELEERTTEEVMEQYAVPFFIWANYDIEERKDVVISPNYLGVLTAQVAGLPLPGYMNFLAQMYEELPVITTVGFLSGDGQFLAEEALDEEQQVWLRKYELLNYCGLTDQCEAARPFFRMNSVGEHILESAKK